MELEYTKKDYEISIYKNELQPEEIKGEIKYLSYFKQIKIATIGSNKYKSPIDACSPKFTININGKKTLTFNMYYKYFDYDIGDYQLNPLIGLLHNDTLIQLKLDGEYHDLLITKIQKNSDNYVYSFTAEDAYITELGKNGFNAELNLQLENSMGTVNELGATILKNSDWFVDTENSDKIIQSLEDSLYKFKVTNFSNFVKRTDYLPDAYYIHDPAIKDYSQIKPITGYVYVFYNDIVDTSKEEVGFLFWNGEEDKVILNADGLVVNSYNYITTDANLIDSWRNDAQLAEKLSIMRGRRVVRSPKMNYDFDLKKVVTHFKKEDDETDYYGYAETDYMSPILTENYISNPCNMTSLYDWGYVNHGEKTNTRPRLLWQAMPEPEKAPYVSYLKTEAKTEILNKGLQGHRNNIKSITAGDKFVVAFLKSTGGYGDFDIGESLEIEPTVLTGLKLSIAFYRYKTPDSSDILKFDCPERCLDPENEQEGTLWENSFSEMGDFTIVDSLYPEKSKTYAYCIYEYDGPTFTDLTEDLDSFLGFFIKSTAQNQYYEVMLFKYREYNGEIVYPGRIFTAEDDETDTATPLCQTYYNIYKDDNGESILVARTLNTDDYEIVFNEDCEKVGSLEGKEKNYYTLLSDLTKTFECWMEIEIDREANGAIKYQEHYYGPNNERLGLTQTKKEKIVTYSWEELELDDEPTNEMNGYKIGDTYYPVKEISYLEDFEKFSAFEGYTNIPRKLIEDKYYLNYLYIVNYVGQDVAAGVNHPEKKYYLLRMNYSYNTINATTALMKPIKKIRFKNYLNDTPNWAGFKYGINVKNIQRSEDNSKFSTKVIVKNNNNEFALNGDKLCTIARAENNPTRDNFIIDFNYYIRQGMLDREATIRDLYNVYYPEIRRCNLANEGIIEEHVHHSTELDKIQAEYETYYLAYNACWENIYEYCKKVENCGEKYAIAKKEEDGTWDFSDWHFGGLCPIKDKIAMICYADSEEGMTNTVSSQVFAGVEFSDAAQDEEDEETGTTDAFTQHEMEWYDLPVIYAKNNKFYQVNESTGKIDNYSGDYEYFYVYMSEDDLEEAFGEKYKEKGITTKVTYKGRPSASNRYHNKSDYYWNKALYDYACRIDEDLLKQKVYSDLYSQKYKELADLKETMQKDIKASVDYIAEKDGILHQFLSKYSDFIRESSWSNDTYVDDELYYLDARDSLHAAAFPQISYTINVVDVDEVEDYSVYKLKVGDYTFVEDTEFFGWDDFKRPAKEWVVVTEATYDLEQPQNNSIKIQNYKTQIEDLFSRLSASIQNLELNKGGYNREIYSNRLPVNIQSDATSIHSSNYSREHNTGWALFNDGTWFLGGLE